MPAPVRIAAVIAILALLVPAAARGQSGDGGAGDSQYQDPFGTQTQSKPSAPKPPAQQQPAQQQPSPQPTPDHTAPAPAATAAAQTQAHGGATRALPRTGFNVLPVVAAGLLLLVGGLALWRRPHGER